jgi:hypothetical protein
VGLKVNGGVFPYQNETHGYIPWCKPNEETAKDGYYWREIMPNKSA